MSGPRDQRDLVASAGWCWLCVCVCTLSGPQFTRVHWGWWQQCLTFNEQWLYTKSCSKLHTPVFIICSLGIIGGLTQFNLPSNLRGLTWPGHQHLSTSPLSALPLALSVPATLASPCCSSNITRLSLTSWHLHSPFPLPGVLFLEIPTRPGTSPPKWHDSGCHFLTTRFKILGLPDLVFEIPSSTERYKGSLDRWPVSGLAQRKYKMSLDCLLVPES